MEAVLDSRRTKPDHDRQPPGNAQLTGRVSSVQRADFDSYARRFGLNAATLLALLVSRELRCQRLPELLDSDEAPEAHRVKVTVHGGDPSQKTRFRQYVRDLDVSLSRACGALIRTELAEEWLDAVLMTRFESPRHG